MTNVSKKKLRSKVYKTIDDQFIKTIARLDEKTTKTFLKNFLTATERVMFAKRLAVMLLLKEDFSPYRIARLLNVSTSTVRRIHAQMLSKDIKLGTSIASIQNEFFKEFRDFLFKGLSMSPKRRVQWLNDFEKKYG